MLGARPARWLLFKEHIACELFSFLSLVLVWLGFLLN